MATQIATDVRGARATTDEQARAAPGVTTSDATAGAHRDHERPGMAALGAVRSPRALAAALPPSTIAFLSLATIGVAAVFAFGLNYRRAILALRHMADDALEIRVPVLLPVTLAAVARAIMANRRAASSMDDVLHHAR